MFLATGLAAVGVFEALAVAEASRAEVAVILLMSAPLIWRRDQSHIVAIIVTLTLAAQLPFESIRIFDQTFTGYVCLLVAMYSVGRHGRGFELATISCCAILAGMTIGLYDRSAASFVIALVFVAAPAALGGAIRARVGVRSMLEAQSAELAATTEVMAAAEATAVRAKVATDVQMIVDREVRAMTDRARQAASQAIEDQLGAARLIAEVEEHGRRSLTDMRRLVGVMREGDDLVGPPESDRHDDVAVRDYVGRQGPGPAIGVVGLLLIATLVAVSAVEAASLTDGSTVALALAGLGGALMPAPLVLSRKHPLLASVLAWTVAVVLTAYVGLPSFSLVLVAPLFAYAAGAFASHRPGIVGLLIGIGGVLGVNVAVSGSQWGDYLFPGLLVLLAWSAGRMMATQARMTAAVATRADELRRLREVRTTTAATQERLLMARELHDVVAHTLMIMVVQSGAARRTLEAGRPGWSEALDVVVQAGTAASIELERLLSLVGPVRTPGPSGLSLVPDLVDRIRAAGCAVDLRMASGTTELPEELQLAAYRIVQESLTNVLRHAGPTHVDVHVERRAGRLVITVLDDGPRTSRQASTDGNGIPGMRERVRMLGGQMRAEPTSAGGFLVLADLPLAVAEEPTPA